MIKKSFLIINYIILITAVLFFNISQVCAKDVNIDEVLENKSYSSLSIEVKEYIKKYYEENGVVLLTKALAKPGETYLNPRFIEYLESDEKYRYGVIPSITLYATEYNKTNSLTDFKKNDIFTSNKKGGTTKSEPTFPSKFDLRDVDGKNFVTPNKNQGQEGLCWAYATASILETHDLIEKNKSYDETARLFSEKQMDYALSTNGIIGGNKIIPRGRTLSSGAQVQNPIDMLAERLGGVLNTWDNNNQNEISSNSRLAPSAVFNRGNTIYEIGSTTKLYNVGEDSTNVELNETYKSIIKDGIYNKGGALVAIGVRMFYNSVNFQDYINVSLAGYNDVNSYHGVHLIGWDDDYEYSYCTFSATFSTGDLYKFVYQATFDENNQKVCRNGGKEGKLVTGRGAWIVKNSWGMSNSYIYIPYDSLIDEIEIIDEYTTQEWDNSYQLNYSKTLDDSIVYEIKNMYNILTAEDAALLKISFPSSGDYNVYFSEDGNNYTLVDTIHTDYAGYKSIDLRNKNLNVTNNSIIRISGTNTMLSVLLFTNNKNSSSIASTSDFSLNLENDKPSKGGYLDLETKTYIRNVDDNVEISYKIKYANGSYLPNNAYDVSENKVYYNLVTPLVRMSANYAKKGEYLIETWKGNTLLTTSSVNLDIDFMPIDGDGTENNPWKIKNTRHFNMIRNASNDNYIMMNDIDFYHDTQESDGLFYRSGKGWKGIMGFDGNFDGNGKTIKNILANNGIFGAVLANDGNCSFIECGIHDLKVDTLINNDSEQYDGGIMISLHYSHTYKYNFSNLSLVNGIFKGIYSDYIGGIVGRIDIADYVFDLKRTILKIDNWYVDANFSDGALRNYGTEKYIGGVIGYINAKDEAESLEISLNNVKANVHFDLMNDYEKKYYVSDIIGGASAKYSRLIINNALGNASYEYSNGADVTLNAFIGYVDSVSNEPIKINGSKSTLNYVSNDLISITNYEAGLKPYELARANYDNIVYYEDRYYVYDQNYDTTTPVNYSDRYKVYGDKIPSLRKYSDNYSNYVKNYAIRIGETKTINDLISIDTKYRKLNVYTNFSCDLSICNNATNQTIISAPTESNGYSFSGLKSGSTTLILYDELSGYLDAVNIVVLGSDEYKLILDANDGSTSSDILSIKNNKEYGTLPVPKREQYTFVGWFTEKTNGTEVTSNTIFDGDTDTTIYAHWEKNAINYTVSFDSRGGSEIKSQSVLEGNKVVKPTNPTKKGYIFNGWMLSGNIYDFNTPVTGDITLIALWEIKNTVTITFDTDGGTEIPNQVLYKNQLATKPENDPIKEGYMFIYWATCDNNSNCSMYDFTSPVTDDITIKASWYEFSDVTVTFDSNGGSNVASQTIKYNSKATKPANPTKDGYHFVEWQYWIWNNGTSSLVEYDFNERVKGNITLYASWREVDAIYTVTFNCDGGSSVASQTINCNEKATKPSNPTKTGYTFKEWQLNGSTYDFNIAVTSNITLKAVWEVNKYTITFNSDGGSSVASQTINYNEKATKPSNPTKTGYTFKEWQLNGSTYDFNTAVTSNIILKAVWDKNEVIDVGTMTLKNTLENNGYSVNGSFTSKFTLGDSIATIKNKLGNDVIIETNNSIISTGAVIKKGNENYTVVIKGDLNGDGRVNSADLLRMRKYLLEEVNLTGAYKEAGIIESNGEIKSLDLLRLRQYLLDEYVFK